MKAWKNIGMELTDRDDRFVLIDDEIFDPVYEFLAREDIPILMHIGSLEYDVSEVAKRFERYPNFAVDVSARLGDLMAQDPR